MAVDAVYDFSKTVGVKRRRRENRGAEGERRGERLFPLPLGKGSREGVMSPFP